MGDNFTIRVMVKDDIDTSLVKNAPTLVQEDIKVTIYYTIESNTYSIFKLPYHRFIPPKFSRSIHH